MKRLTVVQAPGIPETERKHLEAHWKEALADPDYTVITNYEVRVDVLDIEPDHAVMVVAPGLPPAGITALRKRLDKAKARKNGLIVTNYEVCVDQVSIKQK